jgi:hypothetical protein
MSLGCLFILTSFNCEQFFNSNQKFTQLNFLDWGYFCNNLLNLFCFSLVLAFICLCQSHLKIN